MDVDRLMAEALVEARRARDGSEVPIGAIVALNGEIIGRGFNHPIGAVDPTAHAEIAAMRAAAARIGNYRLTGAVVSTVRGAELPGHNHRVEIVPGVREEECRALMLEFFKERR
jgi:tRNA(Arg) A34 adenosine deaminase TadA